MADAVVSPLLQNLSQLLRDEFKLLSGVEDKIKSLCNELKFIDIFLKSSIGKRNDELVKEVVNQIRDVGFKAEDVVGIYVASVAQHRSRNIICRLFHLTQRVMVLREVNDEIENIKNRIDKIYKNRERYGITEGASTSEDVDAIAAESLRERRKDVEEKDVVGFVNDSNSVIEKLMQEGDSGRKVASIVGMGGLGKTTLARKIYNNDQVKNSFPTRAWGYVSNDYRARELLLSLLKCFLSTWEYDDLFKKKEDEVEAIATSEEKLKTKVRECLKGKKYLIVLDDIWKTQVWNKIKDAFPDDDHSIGRILITSREMEVANYVGTTSPYHLSFLNKEESWQLFYKKVFRDKGCPPDLEPLGKSIVESCKGLPLPIVVLAGHVAKKEKSQREWTRIKNITWQLTQDKMEVMDILKLSYDSLSQRLKPCFLYFGIYPEDYEIRARDVIQMWMAEGFIQPREAGIQGAAEPEDVAEYYLDELVDRSLAQVASRKSDGRVKTCRIHDLLRDLCISESKSEKFVEVCRDPNDMDTLSNDNPRRLSIQCKEWSNFSTNNLNQLCTRSLFFFYEGEEFPEDVLLKSFKLARVIYFKTEGHYYKSAAMTDFKKMIHLRHLRIDKTVISIPASVRNLRNLETLDVGGAEMVSNEIWKLKQLKHLYIRMYAWKVEILPKLQRKIKGNLQTLFLRCFEGEDLVSLLNNDIFPRLRKLMFSSYNTSHEPLPSLNHLTNLHSLKINNCLELPSDANVPSNLTKITLQDFSDPVNELIFLKNMKIVGKLASLQVLKLKENYFNDVLNDLKVGAGEFPQLKVFKMSSVKVKSWRLEKGAMPCLQNLVIKNCRWLEEIPEELWSLTTLREAQVLNPNKELSDRLRNVELKNGCKLILSGLAWELTSEEEDIN
ncbi:putative disease resistance RPP13-like protein 3 [Abrus precatorius]|uniref:Disease resistance RPP13-like protein 3 n=1 Tax=Abrus precatorius TaxID=3816 RepID=A0A8B8L583_ABRPR|nr:putative disease resistance RPP13-like protein 3 [Abrus precatorius]